MGIPKDILKRVSAEVNLPEDVVECAYKSFFEYIRGCIEILPLKDNLSQEEFDSLKTNFNIPSLGKLYCNYDKYKGIKKRMEYIRRIKNESKED